MTSIDMLRDERRRIERMLAVLDKSTRWERLADHTAGFAGR